MNVPERRLPSEAPVPSRGLRFRPGPPSFGVPKDHLSTDNHEPGLELCPQLLMPPRILPVGTQARAVVPATQTTGHTVMDVAAAAPGSGRAEPSFPTQGESTNGVFWGLPQPQAGLGA